MQADLRSVFRGNFILCSQVVSIPAGGTLMESTAPMDFLPGFNLEGFPNRDSTKYSEQYGIESAHTLIRGTLRFKVGTATDLYNNVVLIGWRMVLLTTLGSLLFFPPV